MERERAAEATDGEAPFAGAFFYLSALLLLFSLHNAFIFNQDLLGAAQAFALLNGLVLATVAMKIGGSRAAAGRFVTVILTRSVRPCCRGFSSRYRPPRRSPSGFGAARAPPPRSRRWATARCKRF